jgi:hypothetical protein
VDFLSGRKENRCPGNLKHTTICDHAKTQTRQRSLILILANLLPEASGALKSTHRQMIDKGDLNATTSPDD